MQQDAPTRKIVAVTPGAGRAHCDELLNSGVNLLSGATNARVSALDRMARPQAPAACGTAGRSIRISAVAINAPIATIETTCRCSLPTPHAYRNPCHPPGTRPS
jgi:hypothetical protein